MNSLDKTKNPLYVEGERTTIKGTTFELGDHAVLKFASIDNHFEGEVTKIGNHTIYLNEEMFQLNNCVGAEKIDLSNAKIILSAIENDFSKVKEIYDSLSIADLELLLKGINNKIGIYISKFNKIEINYINNKSDYDYILNIINIKAKILEKLQEYNKFKFITICVIDLLKSQELEKKIKEGGN